MSPFERVNNSRNINNVTMTENREWLSNSLATQILISQNNDHDTRKKCLYNLWKYLDKSVKLTRLTDFRF